MTTDPRGDSKSAGCGFTKLHQLPKSMFCWVAPTNISSELMMSDFPERITLVIRKSFNVLETIEVATTRPETMLGDSGIAVHPDDPRYTHLVGKFAVHPFIQGRRLPIVADTYVDREFGTGAVKLTPAHDPNDFNLGMAHKLEFINILADDGFINENGGPYQGQKRFDVRYSLQEDLKKIGLYVDKKDNPMSVPLSERTKDVVEPIMKPQWWVKMSCLAGDAVRSNICGLLMPCLIFLMLVL